MIIWCFVIRVSLNDIVFLVELYNDCSLLFLSFKKNQIDMIIWCLCIFHKTWVDIEQCLLKVVLKDHSPIPKFTDKCLENISSCSRNTLAKIKCFSKNTLHFKSNSSEKSFWKYTMIKSRIRDFFLFKIKIEEFHWKWNYYLA